MKYTLRGADSASTKVIANAAWPDNFAAEKWAKEWVKQNGELNAYVLERDGGGFAQRVFKTTSGHWYLTPVSNAA